MNKNKLQHNLLEKLYIQHLKKVDSKINNDKTYPIYVSYEELTKSLNIDFLELNKVISVMVTNDDVSPYNVGGKKGFLITDNGISAYSTDKYLKLYHKSIKEIILFYVQATIPILSMIVAIIAVSNNNNEKIEKLDMKLQKMQLELTNIKEFQDNNEYKRTNSLKLDSLKR